VDSFNTEGIDEGKKNKYQNITKLLSLIKQEYRPVVGSSLEVSSSYF
jgi:hypothetical protein